MRVYYCGARGRECREGCMRRRIREDRGVLEG